VPRFFAIDRFSSWLLPLVPGFLQGAAGGGELAAHRPHCHPVLRQLLLRGSAPHGDHQDKLVHGPGGHSELVFFWQFVLYISLTDHSLCSFVYFYYLRVFMCLAGSSFIHPEHDTPYTCIFLLYLYHLSCLNSDGKIYLTHLSQHSFIGSSILRASYWKSPNKIRDLFGPFITVYLDIFIGWVKMINLREKAAKH
jgi:hypothetical protein